jgi:protein TonB
MTAAVDVNQLGERDSLPRLLLVSLGLHVALLVIVPLVALITRPVKVFERPRTFQLVRPLPRMTQSPPKPKTAVAKPKAKAVEPAPSKTKAPAPAKDEPKPQETEEDVSELESLLNAMPSPVEASAAGNFKYPWYVMNLAQKVEQNYHPPSQRPDIFTEVAFTIFADGSISDVRVTKSCGTVTFDNLAIRAVKVSAPFGKLPAGFLDSKLELTFVFRPVQK